MAKKGHANMLAHAVVKGLKPSAVTIYKDTCDHKCTLYKVPSPTMQSHMPAVLSIVERRQHKPEDMTTAESLRLVTSLSVVG